MPPWSASACSATWEGERERWERERERWEREAWGREVGEGEAWVRRQRGEERRKARERLAHQQARGFVAFFALLLEGRDHARLEHVPHAVRVHQLLRYTTHDTRHTTHDTRYTIHAQEGSDEQVREE
jgi:hypothetical protein